MAKNKFTDKIKEGVSVHEIEHFARKHTMEVLAVAALVIGAISSAWDFFTGPKLTIFLFTLGAVLGIFFPNPVEKGMRQLYNFACKQEKTTQIIFGAVKIVVAIFIPFVLFGIFGLLSGTAYHYFTRHSQGSSGGTSHREKRENTDEEHD
jgi:hypothetical protein